MPANEEHLLPVRLDGDRPGAEPDAVRPVGQPFTADAQRGRLSAIRIVEANLQQVFVGEVAEVDDALPIG